ncbi:flagellin N-terminal helical domain-containing protein [Sulfurospirillum cavolei]|uniref:flagellin N-terminal helical domain-containing protein n=1 Tax=Sulfurospirillum cavolei TaxID=366522 RepID=UPI0005AA34A9|nr:flagellin [Sulfurospirillum cavolei]
MRITNSLLHSTSLRNYRTNSESLYNINQQIASKLKIQNSYEDTGIYIDAMRLNTEIDTLTQSSAISSKAATFANNTDTTLTSFSSTLDQFKAKLVQASTSTNSTTSLEALANDLTGIKQQLLSLANTSINGQFLFSGSSLNQKPIDAYGNYQGNDENLKALIGSGVELDYNINGQSLFLGKDSDYSKIVSSNVALLNQSKLHPDVMTQNSQNETASEVYITQEDTIRDLVGDTNNNASDDGKAVFYLSGRKSNGTTFSNTIKMDTGSKVSNLLDSIGEAYGNTATNKVVSVSLNAHGQIEVKDLMTGHQTLEMNMFGAIDRNATAGQTGDAEQIMNIDNLTLHPNVDIIAFNKSNYATSLSSPDLTMRSSVLSGGNFGISFPQSGVDTSTISTTTALKDIFPADVDHLDFGATSFSIAGKTVQDLMSAIDTEYYGGVPTATLGSGMIKVPTNVVSIVPKNASNGLAHGNALPDAMNYARRGFEKDGNLLSGNVSQVVKSTNNFATASTKLVDVAGVDSLNGKQLVLNFTDKNGISRTGTLNLDSSDTTFSIDLDGDGIINSSEPNEIISIYNGKGDLNNTKTKADDMTYQQLLDIVSMVTSGNIPKQGVTSDSQTAINNAIAFGVAGDTTNRDAQAAIAKSGVSLETQAYIQKAIDAGIVKANPTSSAAQIAQATIDYDNAIANANIAEYNYALSTAKNSVEATLDYKGRINIVDKKSSETKIALSMYDKSATDFTGIGSTALSFMANDSVTVESPSVDIFKQLDEMIEAVRSGNLYMDASSDDPRAMGIQNALLQIDHIADHVNKAHTKIGALGNALTDANARSEMLTVNVKTVQNSVISVDTAEAYLEYQAIYTSYQAMLSTLSQINKLSLLDYM